jgi:hypothetical protein
MFKAVVVKLWAIYDSIIPIITWSLIFLLSIIWVKKILIYSYAVILSKNDTLLCTHWLFVKNFINKNKRFRERKKDSNVKKKEMEWENRVAKNNKKFDKILLTIPVKIPHNSRKAHISLYSNPISMVISHKKSSWKWLNFFSHNFVTPLKTIHMIKNCRNIWYSWVSSNFICPFLCTLCV